MTRRRRFGILILATTLLSTFVSIAHASAQEKAAGPHWGYTGHEGPEHWGDLDPKFALCKDGKRQSPINIVGAQQGNLKAIQFDYKPSPLKIIDNGHTIQINYAAGSSITIGQKRYSLVQFHFHHPSEDEIAGKRFDMVLHIVHQDAAGNGAVVAILLKEGRENPFIEKLWNHLPKEVGKESSVPNVTINVADALPTDQNYFTFAGSLTIPPCTEGITWYVLKTPGELSRAQIAAFRKLYPHNARPLQPAHGRRIQESGFQK